MAHTIHSFFTITSSAFWSRATAVGTDNLLNYDQSTTKIHMMTISSGTFGDWVLLESKQSDSYVISSGLKGVRKRTPLKRSLVTILSLAASGRTSYFVARGVSHYSLPLHYHTPWEPGVDTRRILLASDSPTCCMKNFRKPQSFSEEVFDFHSISST
eukprot:scaffold22643_cov70-Skeletonema_dohrnii-CCMP3373.AAC.2